MQGKYDYLTDMIDQLPVEQKEDFLTATEVNEVIDQGQKNCINCIKFKVCKGSLRYADCTEPRAGFFNMSTKIKSTAKRILTNNNNGKVYGRMDCEYYEGDCDD